jgi:NAD(P)-dependent dehydrogenase (short-subunit alcohol dehydrogenase family)
VGTNVRPARTYGAPIRAPDLRVTRFTVRLIQVGFGRAPLYAYFNGAVNAPYAMSKAGVEQFGRALRTELAIHGATAGVLYPGWVKTPIARAAFGDNDLVTQVREQLYPRFLGTAIHPDKVAARVTSGIEKRSPRIVVPRRWEPISALRGIVNPLTDLALDRNTELHGLLRQLETRTGK